MTIFLFAQYCLCDTAHKSENAQLRSCAGREWRFYLIAQPKCLTLKIYTHYKYIQVVHIFIGQQGIILKHRGEYSKKLYAADTEIAR